MNKGFIILCIIQTVLIAISALFNCLNYVENKRTKEQGKIIWQECSVDEMLEDLYEEDKRRKRNG